MEEPFNGYDMATTCHKVTTFEGWRRETWFGLPSKGLLRPYGYASHKVIHKQMMMGRATHGATTEDIELSTLA